MNNTVLELDNYAPVIPPDLSVFEKIDCIVNKKHISHLTDYPILRCPDALKERDVTNSACLFPIRNIVYDRSENNIQKLSSVYSGAAAINANVVMLINNTNSSTGNIEMYMGVCDEATRDAAYTKTDILYRDLVGNFPGCRISSSDKQAILGKSDTAAVINRCLPEKYHAVCAVSGVGSFRGQAGLENESFFQGIEKVIEAMEGRDYSIILLARNVSQYEIEEMKAENEMLYTQLMPFSKSTLSINESTADGESKTLSDSLANTVSRTDSQNLSIGESRSDTKTHGYQIGTADSIGGNAGISIGAPGNGVHFGVHGSHQTSRGENWSNAATFGNSRTVSDGESKTQGQTVTVTMANGETYTYTKGQTVQLTYENKTITETLASIEKQLERLKSGMGLGMFAVTAYFISPTVQGAKAAASAYKSIIAGDSTSLESTNINSWAKTGYEAILPYLRNLCHPVFILDSRTTVTAASVVTSAELALHMSLPKSAVKGISVRETVAFGRNIMKLDETQSHAEKIELGETYHLGHTDNQKAFLDLDSLTMHLFITGTTGAGKSNTIYGILDRLLHSSRNIHFLIVEPAKGEYKDAFAGAEDVQVYGMNPYKTPLLRVNPFSFPEDVHILEHLDRLMDIFNVCWPMYAAMPAVLKEALERAYSSAGWNLRTSRNKYSKYIFPTFADVMHEVENVMEESRYSADNKGDYIGSLCTRLRELTTGINGMIFVSDELSYEELFEQNVIVDLSRIGSAETKSMVMGLLVIKLQEYRMSVAKEPNAPLRHVTVLEEAHHLLKRTSTDQSMEGANLVGHSVEMLTNAFAEMRTYGEGFIIADQSPGLMDISVIRNTNTKIVMRLPEQSDRELVGRAIGLNDIQITELPKLSRGVGAVYQNDWIEAVLVKMPYFKGYDGKYSYQNPDIELLEDDKKQSLMEAIMKRDLEGWIDSVDGIKADMLAKYNLPTGVKCRLLDYVDSHGKERLYNMAKVAYEFFNTADAMNKSLNTRNIEDWKESVVRVLSPSVSDYDQNEIDLLLALLIREQAIRDGHYKDLYCAYMEWYDTSVR